METENDNVIEGQRGHRALRAGVAIDKIFLMKGETDSALGHIASAAREKGIVVDADRRKLDGMSRTTPTRALSPWPLSGVRHRR